MQKAKNAAKTIVKIHAFIMDFSLAHFTDCIEANSASATVRGIDNPNANEVHMIYFSPFLIFSNSFVLDLGSSSSNTAAGFICIHA